MDLNSSKLSSPIILIDPTYKERNALAALNQETFDKFKKEAIKFLKNPKLEDFEKEKIDLEKIKKNANKNKNEFIFLVANTNKQEGDVAGSKLLKFYKILEEEMKKYFVVKNKGFNYSGKKSARYFFVVKAKKEIIFNGPFLGDEKNVKNFKKEHGRGVFTKGERIYAKKKIDFSVKEFFEKWAKENKKKVKEMYIDSLKVVKT